MGKNVKRNNDKAIDVRNEDVVLDAIDSPTLQDNEEMAFLEYQEEVRRSSDAKRNRAILILLSVIVFILGLGVFSTIAVNIYQMWPIGGIVVGICLFVAYSIAFIGMFVLIYKKQSFDLEFKKRNNGVNSERKNNRVRWEIATNIYEQGNAVMGLYHFDENDDTYATLCHLVENHNKYKDTYRSKASKELAETLTELVRKNGVIYKAAQKKIRTEAVACGAWTAISQNAFADVGIIAFKNLQMIKSIIWLYGFRPTDQEMIHLTLRVIKNVSIGIGLNTMPKGVNLASKVLNKDSTNFLVQILGSFFDMGSQFLVNGSMTYLIGRETVKVMLKEYRMQDLFRIQLSHREEFLLSKDEEEFKELNQEIKEIVMAKQKENVIEPELVEVKDIDDEPDSSKHHFRKLFQKNGLKEFFDSFQKKDK